MEIEKRNWLYSQKQIEEIDLLVEGLNIQPTTAKLLLNRGIKNLGKAKVFLHPSLEELYDPYLLKDMDKAVKRIQYAVENNQAIWIYGDYDVDGVASVSIMLKYFYSIGYSVNYYIPDRMEEGYGINPQAIKEIADKKGDLIITVDCGITSIKEVELANSLGIDMIITDHHQCHGIIPKAYAIINPKQEDCHYPYDMICGCGVAFKLIQALTPKEIFKTTIYQYLDITTIATIADIVPLLDENRIIVKNGLNYMRETNNIGLQALIEISNLKDKKLNASHIGFGLAPRINAAGRIGSADIGVRLFTTENREEAKKLAKMLDEENYNRQQVEAEILDEAIKMIEENPKYREEKVLVLYKENWHHGVIGIVASRIVEKYYKPTIILAIENDTAKGSARSITGFNLFDALNQCKDLFIKFGGHEQAAGLSLVTDNIEAFRTEINKLADQILLEDDLVPKIFCDDMLNLESINHQLISELETLEPYGLANMAPRFIHTNLKPKGIKSVGVDGKHLKMSLQEDNKTFDTIGFNLGNYAKVLTGDDTVGIIFSPEYNEFNGTKKIQLNIKDLKIIKGSYVSEKFIESYYKSLQLPCNENNYITNRELEDIPVKATQEKQVFIIKELQNQDKVLILVNTFHQANHLITLTEIQEKNTRKRVKFFYNEIPFEPQNKEIHILINPNIDKISFKLYNSIIVYDMFFMEKDYYYLIDRNQHAPITFLYEKGDEKNNEEILKSIVPTRNILILLYKFLKEFYHFKKAKLEEILEKINEELSIAINPKILENAIHIFIEGNLIKCDVYDEQYYIEILKVTQKVDIEKLDAFRHYNNLYKDFIDFKNKWIGFIQGGKSNGFS
ncbi:single-stranded-DNA-specific exonuclease RecJ [Natronincola ferrireducens]|uniref:Single-stranded-DNA-specific exonuclease RecJ n=1 Tax=Natronincola ferrireducens TaxID=393762 RepID=A0A1G9CWP7_9FIRM|nr:single-stranded-DNA-specific exonuclease RecJ [Natronincola ferrireducens]SDK56108.1 single-stranded-DNA-specific exonuclease [Natronincola ferrireducens]